MKKIRLEKLREFAIRTLESAGVSRENAAHVADTLVTTDTFGVMTHGTKNLCQYIEKMKAGGLDAAAEPTVEREGPAWAMVNGNKAIGMVSACKAMNLAIEKAKKVGIAYVGVKNSCHFGASGYYANLAASKGLIGLSMSNADPIMTVPNGCRPVIGTNPFSFAAPLSNGKSVFLDIALSNVAALKIIMAQEKGQKIPADWLIDRDGKPTDDAHSFPKNSCLAPMGAHKGYGLAVLVEIPASVMTGAGILSEIASWNLDLSSVNNAGHAFIAIDVAQMMPYETFLARMDQMVDEIHNAPKAQHASQIYLPGEMEWQKRDMALANGEIELTDAMAASLKKLSDMTGVVLETIG